MRIDIDLTEGPPTIANKQRHERAVWLTLTWLRLPFELRQEAMHQYRIFLGQPDFFADASKN